MKYESYLGDARSVGELDAMIGSLSRDGFRIVNVLDRSSLHDDRFLIVAQKDVDAQIHIGGNDRYDRLPRHKPDDTRFGTNER